MTRAEFNAKHSDFRTVIDGHPFVLSDEGAKGTCLVPVELLEDPSPAARQLERIDEDLRNFNGERFHL